jgi:peptide/nickel transport system ATP-binding protein
MYLGNIMELGPAEELFEDPSNPYTLSLLSAIPEPDPTLEKDRITLRGTPPSPRDPPSGCPFSTRCPVKIRPEEYRDLPDDVWEGINVIGEIARERSRADRSVREIVKELLGIETRFTDISEVQAEAFAGVDVPPRVQTVVDEATDRIQTNDDEGALAVLEEEFGSICDREFPDHHQVSDAGRTSLCHRHLPDYEEADELFGDVLPE